MRRRPRAFTLVEVLVATALTLMMMGAVVTVFSSLGQAINDSRSTLEMTDRLRATAARLQRDLEGVTVTMLPPRRPEDNEGYFEYTEGPVGVVIRPEWFARNLDQPRTPTVDDPESWEKDTTVGDFDDMLMFTTHSRGQPFVGKYGGANIESDAAEVAWFVRGRTLYRRVLLVAPSVALSVGPGAFYYQNDISVRNEGGTLFANTLGDLTKPENRFAHQYEHEITGTWKLGFPFHPHVYYNLAGLALSTGWAKLGLPTLRECSDIGWDAGGEMPRITLTPADATIDLWNDPHPWDQVDTVTGTWNTYMNDRRIAEDVILTNVIGFDVKAWDPDAPVLTNGTTVALVPGDPGYVLPPAGGWTVASYGAYVDLNYAGGNANTAFAGPGEAKSGLGETTTPWLPRVYDTWSLHYEHDGVDQFEDGIIDTGTDGFDNGGVAGIVDDIDERETLAPYPVVLRGIQVKIRVYEPDSRQVREMTVVQDFLPK